MKNSDFFRNEGDYADLDADGAVRRLSRALQFRTVTGTPGVFDDLHRFLRESYPLLAEKARWEEVGKSLLLTLEGTDPALKPALFMAHQDVVPVVPGTEGDWLHDPFSGDVADGFIWGRGALDIKEMLIAELESAEYHLARGKTFRRTVLFAFGEDEEVGGAGTGQVVKLLQSRGVEPEFVLDEGAGRVTEASDYGAPGVYLCSIGIYEKGYADLKLSVSSRGGHSSNPFRGTSLGVLAKAIATVTEHPPAPHLSEALRRTFETLKPRITEEPLKTYAADPGRYEKELLAYCLTKESLYHQVQTTVAPTQITPGAPAGNVMPQKMEAVINFRLAPPDTPESLFAHYRALLPPEVGMTFVQAISPSRPSRVESFGYERLKKVLEHYFEGPLFVPVQNRGATDARQYEVLCPVCLRCGPFLEEEDISDEGIHGTNERISIRAYLQGIRVLIRMMEDTCA